MGRGDGLPGLNKKKSTGLKTSDQNSDILSSPRRTSLETLKHSKFLTANLKQTSTFLSKIQSSLLLSLAILGFSTLNPAMLVVQHFSRRENTNAWLNSRLRM